MRRIGLDWRQLVALGLFGGTYGLCQQALLHGSLGEKIAVVIWWFILLVLYEVGSKKARRTAEKTEAIEIKGPDEKEVKKIGKFIKAYMILSFLCVFVVAVSANFFMPLIVEYIRSIIFRTYWEDLIWHDTIIVCGFFTMVGLFSFLYWLSGVIVDFYIKRVMKIYDAKLEVILRKAGLIVNINRKAESVLKRILLYCGILFFCIALVFFYFDIHNIFGFTKDKIIHTSYFKMKQVFYKLDDVKNIYKTVGSKARIGNKITRWEKPYYDIEMKDGAELKGIDIDASYLMESIAKSQGKQIKSRIYIPH